MIRCKQCEHENPEQNFYCENCGLILKKNIPLRYNALLRIANGYKFFSNLIGILGTMASIGISIIVWKESVIASIFIIIIGGIFTYLLFTGIRALSEIIFLFLNLEENIRLIAETTSSDLTKK